MKRFKGNFTKESKFISLHNLKSVNISTANCGNQSVNELERAGSIAGPERVDKSDTDSTESDSDTGSRNKVPVRTTSVTNSIGDAVNGLHLSAGRSNVVVEVEGEQVD